MTRWSARAEASPDDRFVTDGTSATGPSRATSFEGSSPSDVVGYGSEPGPSPRSPAHPYLAHFDGTRWSRWQPPPGRQVASYVRVGDQAWATTTLEQPHSLDTAREALWSSVRGGAWKRVPLPFDCDPKDLQRTGDGTVWLRCDRPYRHRLDFDQAILSTQTPARPYEMAR